MEAISPLDLLPDGLLTTLLSTAATPEEQQEQQQHQRQQQHQQQYLYGTFPLVCKRFNGLSPRCSSISVGLLEGDELQQFQRWLAKHGANIQQLTMPQAMLQHAGLSTYLPNLQRLYLIDGGPLDDISLLPALTNLTFLSCNCMLSDRVDVPQFLPALRPLTLLQELHMPARNGFEDYSKNEFDALATIVPQISQLQLRDSIIEHSFLTPLTKLQRLQSLLPGRRSWLLPCHLHYIANLPLCSLMVHVGPKDAKDLLHWLDHGVVKQLTSLDVTFSYHTEYASSEVLPRLSLLPQLRCLELSDGRFSTNTPDYISQLELLTQITTLSLYSYVVPLKEGVPLLPPNLLSLKVRTGCLDQWLLEEKICGALSRLTSLSGRITSTECLTALAGLTHLRRLGLGITPPKGRKKHLARLSALTQLTGLHLSGRFTSDQYSAAAAALSGHTQLRWLVISGSASLCSEFPVHDLVHLMAALPQLEQVDVPWPLPDQSNCFSGVGKVSGLAGLTRLNHCMPGIKQTS